MKNLTFTSKHFHVPQLTVPFQGKERTYRSRTSKSGHVPSVKLITCDQSTEGNSRLMKIMGSRTLSN